MSPTSLTDLAAAYRAYNAARLQAIQSATQAKAGSATSAQMQQQALIDYMQAQIQLLTDARSLALQQYDDEIATFQQKIGEVRQLLQAGAGANPVAGPTPPAAPANPAPPANLTANVGGVTKKPT